MIDTQMVSKISLILLLVGGISLGLEGLLRYEMSLPLF